MASKQTDEKAVQEQTSRTIINHLKSHNMHALKGEVIPTKQKTAGGEIVHFIPDLFIPEMKVPIEMSQDEKRDASYMAIGMLPLVVVPANIEGSIEKYIDDFIDFHKKWSRKTI